MTCPNEKSMFCPCPPPSLSHSMMGAVKREGALKGVISWASPLLTHPPRRPLRSVPPLCARIVHMVYVNESYTKQCSDLHGQCHLKGFLEVT